MTYGLVLVGSGMLAMTQVTPETPYGVLAIVFAVMGHGMGSTMAPMTAAVMGAVGAERAGLGSAMTNTSREVGGVLGVAALGTIAFAQVASAIGPLLAGSGLDPAQQEAIAEVGLVLLTAALVANRFIPGRAATREARLADAEPVAAGH
jgi:DHA2 family multidrug resistance protein-like MFS transporter